MLLPTLLDCQRQGGIQQVEIDARSARLLQCWVQLVHVGIVDGIPCRAKLDLVRESAPPRLLDPGPVLLAFDHPRLLAQAFLAVPPPIGFALRLRRGHHRRALSLEFCA